MRHSTVVVIAQDPADSRIQGDEWNADHVMPALSADPSDPAAGQAIMWMSDGTGSGDNGDIMIKVNVGGVVKTATLLDYSVLS